jgi:hypothetical protein
MYTRLKEFQYFSTQLLTLLDKVKDKKVLIYGVHLAMDKLNKWQSKTNTPEELPNMSKKENWLNYAALATFQIDITMLEKTYPRISKNIKFYAWPLKR